MEKQTLIKREIEINQPLDQVWTALADFGNICHGHPAVSKSYVTSLQQEGVGATRHCDFTMMGASAEERVSEWNEGQNIKIEVTELKKMPGIHTMAMDLAIRAEGNKTVLTGTMVYTMKNSFFDLMNHIMMKNMNAKLLDGILAGHKLYMEMGIVVTDKTKLDTSKVRKIMLLFVCLLGLNWMSAQTINLGKSATEITVEVEIDAPLEKVWANFKEVGGIYKNSPTVDTSYVISAIKEGVGTKRFMVMSKSFKGAELEEENIVWSESDHYQKFNAYRIYRVQGIKTMGGDFKLVANGNKTKLRSTLNYSMKNRFFGMMNAMVGRQKFAKTWASIIAGYKYYSETGFRVGSDTKLPTDEVTVVQIKKI